MMTREKAIEIIDFVRSKRPEQMIQDLLWSIRVCAELQEPFTYKQLIDDIEYFTPTKLGGAYGEAGRALRFLKEELKKHK